MLRPGEIAPPFSLRDHSGGETTLERLLSPAGLVLFFYPGDFTPVCTREACTLRDFDAELQSSGIAIAGISPDGVERHAEFHARYKLTYPLLADPHKSVIRLYRADGPFGLGVRRTTYLIDAAGRIVDAVRADLRVARHAGLVRRAMESAARGLSRAP